MARKRENACQRQSSHSVSQVVFPQGLQNFGSLILCGLLFFRLFYPVCPKSQRGCWVGLVFSQYHHITLLFVPESLL